MQSLFQTVLAAFNTDRSLKARVGWVTIGTAIILSLSLSLLVGQISRERIISSRGEFLAGLAFQMADKLDRGMFERYKDIQILASLDDIRQPSVSVENKRSLLETLQRTYSDYAWIGLTDSDGVVVASTGKLLEGKSVAQRPWFQQGQQAPFVGDVHEALLLEKLLGSDSAGPIRFVDVAAPVVNNATLQGVLSAHLSWNWAQEVEQSLLRPLEVSSNVEVLVLSANDRVLLGPSDLAEQTLYLDSLQTEEASSAAYLEEIWPDQQVYLTGIASSQGYRDFEGLGWTVLVRQPARIALAPARFLQTQVFIWGALLGMLFALVAWLHARRIVSAILALTKAADRIQTDRIQTDKIQANGVQTGNATAAIPLLPGKDELSALSHSLHHLVQTLNIKTRSLATANEYLKRDLIEREKTEHKIREQAALLDIATDAIFVRDLNGIIQYWNRGAERIYGWCAEEACGREAAVLLNKGAASKIREKLKQARAQVIRTQEWSGELTKRTRAGKEVIINSRWTLVRNEKNQPTAILTVDTDITEAKQLENQFLRTQRIESLGILSSGIAHDLNNVLTPIMGAAQLLPMTLTHVDQKSAKLIETLESSAQRASDMVKQILAFARGAGGDRTLVQVSHVLQELMQVLSNSLPKHISLQMHFAPALWPVLADATQLQQVFMNLCVNAKDAMPEGGVLILRGENRQVDEQLCRYYPMAHVGPYVMVSVADTGVGMSQALINRIFEPFFTTRARGEGTGLGLSTTLSIVKRHGGFVSVESEEGKGTQFQIFLPAQENCDVEPGLEIAPLSGHGELILVVDDELIIQEMARTALESFNYQVISAGNGPDAIALYTQYAARVQIVLIDMMMPSFSGSQTIKALLEINPDVKVIAMSGLDIREPAPPAVSAFLPKPYSIQDLLAAINAITHPAR